MTHTKTTTNYVTRQQAIVTSAPYITTNVGVLTPTALYNTANKAVSFHHSSGTHIYQVSEVSAGPHTTKM